MDFDKLIRLRTRNPKCSCGKNVYYTREAAEFALRQVTARRLIQYGGEAECEVYECPEVQGSGVWHLTSWKNGHINEGLEVLKAERREARHG